MWNYTLETTESGLRVLRIPMKSSPSVTVLALCNTGSRYERPDQEGIAHFFEHMVFKGTENYPDPQLLASTVDGIGANFNAFTSKEYTGYYVQAASRHFSVAVDVVSDMLLTPKLRQADIDREKGVIIEEINMYMDNPASHVSNMFEQQVFANTGLGHDIIGSKETVSTLTTESFKQFLQEWYGLPNLILVVAGDEAVVTDPTTMNTITTAFSKNGGDRVSKWVDVSSKLDAKPSLGPQRLQVIHRQTEQAHFVLGYQGIKLTDERRYALAVLDAVLGGNMSSRLFSEVREKRGLCYYIHSSDENYHDTGVFGAAAGVDPQRIDEALAVTIQECTALASGAKPITPDELQRTKNNVEGKLLLGLESSRSVATFFGMKQLLTGTIETPEHILEKINAVTISEVQAVAAELLLADSLRMAVVGPFKDEARFEHIFESSK